MHLKVLQKRARRLLEPLAEALRQSHFVLAGGTGLALQYGHRISVDFDFFSTADFSTAELLSTLSTVGKIQILTQDKHTLTLLLDGVKISFFRYWDKFLFPCLNSKFFPLVTPADIALMKLVAIANRGARKDFIDLYFILKKDISLEELLNLLDKKFPRQRHHHMHILKSLNYFEDAEKEPLPRLLLPCRWEEVKKYFLLQLQKQMG